jgi:hypothetical protein
LDLLTPDTSARVCLAALLLGTALASSLPKVGCPLRGVTLLTAPVGSRGAVRPQADRRIRMAGFLFRLETVDGVAADPPTLASAVPDWRVGHSIHLGDRTLLVIGKRDDDADQPPILIVEEA